MNGEINRDEKLLIGRLNDLSNNCYRRYIPVFSAFLNLNEQDIFNSVSSKFPPIVYFLTGGYELAERKLVVFLPDRDTDYELPIKILKIDNPGGRFNKELAHRDYLGSVLGLGIDRSMVGDIVLYNNCAYLFCLNTIADFIVDNLTKVGNSFVTASYASDFPENYSPSFKEITGTVASLRLDAVISLVYNESRSKSVNYIESGLVFVNCKLITTNAYTLNEGDIISVRHKGRFKYVSYKTETKKGRHFIVINKYE